jgi:hypothetical protein
LGAGLGWALKLVFVNLHPIPLAVIVLGAYGLTYFTVTFALGLSESRSLVRRALKILKLPSF